MAEVAKFTVPRDCVPEIPVRIVPVVGPKPVSVNVIVNAFPPAFAPVALKPFTEIKSIAGEVVLPMIGIDIPADRFNVQFPTDPANVIKPGIVDETTPVAVSPAPSVKVNVSIARAGITPASTTMDAATAILEIFFIIQSPLSTLRANPQPKHLEKWISHSTQTTYAH
ncbi:MAG TPA: hypothetical protein VFC07_09255 [Verrucomicrobiae bacterium]|nr:hypothetical protein [Verrucomicrobiae bacterium]